MKNDPTLVAVHDSMNAFFAAHPTAAYAVAAVAIWTIVWKGLALWKAGRNGDKWWFIIMLVLNTLGILEILYIFIFGKKKTPTV